jgi:hypothetical protein
LFFEITVKDQGHGLLLIHYQLSRPINLIADDLLIMKFITLSWSKIKLWKAVHRYTENVELQFFVWPTLILMKIYDKIMYLGTIYVQILGVLMQTFVLIR